MNASPTVASWQQDDLLLTLYAQPGAKRSELSGLHGEALKVRVQAPAIEGRANDALRRFLADAFALPLSHVELVSGMQARHKRWRLKQPQKIPSEWAAFLPAKP